MYVNDWENILNVKYAAPIDNSESKNGLENRMKQMIKVGAVLL